MDGATFNKTYLPLRNTILSVCVALLSNQEEASDMTQDVYLKLWEQRASLDEIVSPQAYAIRLARNRCLDKLKSARERLRDTSEKADFALLQREDISANPHDQLVAKTTEQRLAHWVDQLKEPQRSIFRMRHYDMLSNTETAERLGLQETTVRSALSRLRKEVRQLFEEERK